MRIYVYFLVWLLPHKDIDQSVLHQGEEDKDGTTGHENVDGLQINNKNST